MLTLPKVIPQIPLILVFILALASEFCSGKNDKLIYIGETKNGKKQGLCKGYDREGVLRELNYYSNDTLHGLCTSYDPKGNIYTKAHYNMGIFVDSFFLYYDNGQVKAESWFDSLGRAQGLTNLYFKNGKISMIGYSIDGKTEGTMKGYYETGSLMWIQNYKKGKKDGATVYLNEKGQREKNEFYRNDTLISEERFFPR